MFKAYDRHHHKVVYGAWEDVCNLDRRWWEVTEVILDSDGEEVPKTKKPLVTFMVKTRSGGTKRLEVFDAGDLDGIYVGGGES